MYVRWKKRQMTRTGRCRGWNQIGAHALTAVLVESRRVNGSPRQRFIAHLGTIRVWEQGRGEVAIGTGGQAWWAEIIAFWDRLSRKLDALEEPPDRDAVEAMVSANVPRPDDKLRSDRPPGAEGASQSQVVIQPPPGPGANSTHWAKWRPVSRSMST
jgi:hypothetical protein